MSSPPRANSLGFKRRCRTAVVRSLALATTAAAALLFVQPSSGTPAPVTELDAAPVAVTNRQIAVPEAPMGWASWNAFAAKVDYNVIKKQVDAFVAAGLPEAATTTSTSTRAGGRAPATARATSPSTRRSGPVA